MTETARDILRRHDACLDTILSGANLLALARGVRADGAGSLCWLCGESPFPRGEQPSTATATWWDKIHYPDAGGVCLGCASLLAGRPGDDPPPARTASVLATEGRWVSLRMADWWPYLETPLRDKHVLSWAQSRKQHHWMHAGVSTPECQLIGSDCATIVHMPGEHAELRAAVRGLLAGDDPKRPAFPRSTIVEGTYHPARIREFGPPRWAQFEAVIARYRGDPVLELIAAAAPVLPADPAETEADMIDHHDAEAAELLASIVRGSERRKNAGLEFWSGELRARLERVRRLPLADIVSRLGDACGVPGSALAEAVSRVRAMSKDEQQSVQRAFRERPKLIEAIAFDVQRQRREGTTCESL